MLVSAMMLASKDWAAAVGLVSALEELDSSASILSPWPPGSLPGGEGSPTGSAPAAPWISPRIGAILGYGPEELLAMGASVWERLCVAEHLEALRSWRRALEATLPPSSLGEYRFFLSFAVHRGPAAGGAGLVRLHYESAYLVEPGAELPWAKWISLRLDPGAPLAPFAGLVYRSSDGSALPAPGGTGAEALSPREREILAYCARGYASKETARILGLSIHTVHNHRRAILAKLEAGSMSEAVGLGLARGLVRGDLAAPGFPEP